MVTRTYSIPIEVDEAIVGVAERRFDGSKSAVVTEVLAKFFGIAAGEGGEQPEKSESPRRRKHSGIQ